MTTPTEALERLRRLEADGTLGEFARRHRLAVLVVFGSTARGEPHPRDLDVAVSSRDGAVDLLAVVNGLMEMVDLDTVDVLDLDRAGPVARQHALVPGEPLYEYPDGEFVRQQLRASGERLSTEWMRRNQLARLAEGR